MGKFWVWNFEDDAYVVAELYVPKTVENVTFEDNAAEAFVERHWRDWDFPEEVDVVVLKQVEGRTLEELLPEREVWTVTAQETVTFAACPKEDDDA